MAEPIVKQSAQSAMLGTLFTEAMLLLGTLVTGSLTARLLMPEGRGALAAILYWPQLLAGIGLLSVHEATTYRIGSAPESASSIRASAFWLLTGLAGVTVAVGCAFIPLLLGRERADLVQQSQLYLIAFLPFHFMAAGLYASDQGELHFRRFNALRLINCAIYLGGVVALWYLGRCTPGMVTAASGAGTIAVAIMRFALQKGELPTRPSWSEMKQLLTLAGQFHPATVLLFLAVQMDRLVVVTLWDNEALGKYVVAFSVASAGLSVVGASFHRVLLPHVARIADLHDKAMLLARSVRQATLLLVLLSIALGLSMGVVIPLLFGPSFTEVVGTARLLVLGYVGVALRTIVIQGLRGVGDGRPGTIAAAMSIGVFLLVAWPLGGSFGLPGVAVGLGLANFAACGYLAVYLRHRYQLGIRDLWGLNGATAGDLWTGTLRRMTAARRRVEALVAP
jgi:O-antigen/teichoic acid export membrane protein